MPDVADRLVSMSRAVQRLGISLLVVLLLALSVWLAHLSNDETAQISDNEIQPAARKSGLESDATLTSKAASRPTGAALQEEVGETSEEDEAPFRAAFEAEPVDPDWAPRTAATLSLGVYWISGFALAELSPDKPLGSLPTEDTFGTVLNFRRAPFSTASD